MLFSISEFFWWTSRYRTNENKNKDNCNACFITILIFVIHLNLDTQQSFICSIIWFVLSSKVSCQLNSTESPLTMLLWTILEKSCSIDSEANKTNNKIIAIVFMLSFENKFGWVQHILKWSLFFYHAEEDNITSK